MDQKSNVPKIVEMVFDAAYLVTVIILGIVLLLRAKTPVVFLFGAMATELGLGDAFHLVPRILVAATGDRPRFIKSLSRGKMITSITMTVFYVLLWHAGLLLFSLNIPVWTAVVYALAVMRIILCLAPGNDWAQESESLKGSILRNIPFFLMGVMVIVLFAMQTAAMQAAVGQAAVMQATGGPAAGRFMWLAVLLSFAFYLPVVLWSRKVPKLGMLMLPKTCAYVWIVAMGFGLL